MRKNILIVQEIPFFPYMQYKVERSRSDSLLLKLWFFIHFLGFSMYILCPLYILAITFFFSRHYDVKTCIFVTHELSHRDVMLDSLFTFSYKFKSNLHIQDYNSIFFLLYVNFDKFTNRLQFILI